MQPNYFLFWTSFFNITHIVLIEQSSGRQMTLYDSILMIMLSKESMNISSYQSLFLEDHNPENHRGHLKNDTVYSNQNILKTTT